MHCHQAINPSRFKSTFPSSTQRTGVHSYRKDANCYSIGRLGLMQALAAPAASAESQAVKMQLLQALQGTDRGIFGTTSAKKASITELVAQLEFFNPVPAPIENLHLCAGSWELLYSTITITGVKRTKLGLREFIQLGTMLQEIDMEHKQAVNIVHFSVSGLSQFKGALSIRAGYEPVSSTRVTITFQDAALDPPQLQKLFEKNYDLLLSIFNPQGHLDVTYLDDKHRVGRDDKGNLFVLQRANKTDTV